MPLTHRKYLTNQSRRKKKRKGGGQGPGGGEGEQRLGDTVSVLQDDVLEIRRTAE